MCQAGSPSPIGNKMGLADEALKQYVAGSTRLVGRIVAIVSGHK